LRNLKPAPDLTVTDALIELADGHLVRKMLAFAAGRITEAEVEAWTGAASGARTPMREVQCRGYRHRAWDNRAGRIGLEVPKLHKGSRFPSFRSRPTADKALMAVIQKAYVHGISTQAVECASQVPHSGNSGWSDSPRASSLRVMWKGVSSHARKRAEQCR
jgi:transposase-like protein